MRKQSKESPLAVLRWRTGVIGCLVPVLAGACVLFALAAVDSSIADELADGRGGVWIRATSVAVIAGINVPLALLTLYLSWETFRFAWRWADEIAVEATSSGLRLHGSVFVKPLAWNEISDVSYGLVNRAPSLLIKLRNGSVKHVRGIDNDSGAAERFAALARDFAHRT
ncbi:hypothetical protein GO308_03760 [Sphingomonas sp. SFZ2018-12]|nr:hypothetical protein [Sphingomonas sp. SFZ2018-12]